MVIRRRFGTKWTKRNVFLVKKKGLTENVFYKFCCETSLPGWPYLNRQMSKVWKVIWIFFLIATCGISIHFLVITKVKAA